MTIFVIDLPPDEMERRLREALTVYVDAMRYPRGTENQRAAMWLEHVRRSGWKAVAAVDVPQTQPSTQLPDIIGADPNHELPAADLANAPMVGVAYGYPGAPGQWWQQQVVLGLQRRGFPMHAIARVMSSYFELTELHIHPNAQGRASERRSPVGFWPAAARRASCSPLRKAMARTIERGGCIGGWDSPTSSAAITSPAIRAHSQSWAARFPCRPGGTRTGGQVAVPTHRVWHDDQVRASSPHFQPQLPSVARPTTAVAGNRNAIDAGAACHRVPAGPSVDHHLARGPGVRGDHRGGKTEEQQGHRAQLDSDNVAFSQKVAVSNYDGDGYVGSQAVFSDLTFAELPQLANMNPDAAGVNLSLRRNGNMVILEGRVDLTSVTDADAEVELTVAFPGTVTSTNGDRIEPEVVQWKLKPGVVSTMNAQARYTDPNTRSFTAAGIWLAIASFAAAGVVAALAWVSRDRSRDSQPRRSAAKLSALDSTPPGPGAAERASRVCRAPSRRAFPRMSGKRPETPRRSPRNGC
ncbi:hypothetical protein I551_5650 [Mycobacterium ulcerans str. Harvey]|uniref:LppM domain-containing protein n=1 Tax=Mycobacterium ulcerans str. Harvey TaxID=1299332 RepID=A0ABN0QT12_MYCUL|nr:hypothetical protein I551_5650 [Mycobacterium ulcerans str. Harvey]